MIQLKSVNKQFGAISALKNIDLHIGPGEIVGFLGHNGAGKTTLMRIITTYLPVTSGRVMIDGKDVLKSSLAIRAKLGYLPERPPLYLNMTVKGFLSFAAHLKNVPFREVGKAVDRVCEECWLTKVKGRIIGTLSKGYQQRVGIAQAIINDPALLILDEPTSGLDPLQVVQVRELIKRCEHQRTVIVSTHILSEIENLVSRVVIVKQGEIAADAPLVELLYNSQSKNLEEAFLKLHPVYEKN
ncbi:MAG: ABC transporter ATP-binding protein [Candidatus Omnitrophica bacterium]|nr:ABC transporter ATP-binding protein [Candidatus Omnitrophota bacterium]